MSLFTGGQTCHDECVNRTVDYSALLYPAPKEQVADYRARAKAAGLSWAVVNPLQVVGVIVVALVIGGIVLSFATTFVGVGVSAMSNSGANPVSVVAMIFPLIFIVAFILAIVFLVRSVVSGRNWETWYRLDTFAQANGLVFSQMDANPSYPGAIFNNGDSRKALNHLRSASDRFLDMGNYQYTTGSGKNRSTHNWGFMALHLDRKLPNMVLDAKANNGLFGGTNLPAYFDKYFTLYCPQQYERDALYVFTPDLMALLIDNAAPFDVEIVDDWMFVYSARPFNSADPAVYQRLFQIVDTVGKKTLSQTDRYVDERIGSFAANIVAPQGQRLKRGLPIGAVIVIVGFLLIWGLPQIMGLFSMFAR